MRRRSRARARIYNGRRSPGPRRAPKYHLPAFTCAHSRGLDSQESRTSKKFRAVYSCVFSPARRGPSLTGPRGRCARRPVSPFFGTKYKRLASVSSDSPPIRLWLCSKWVSRCVSFSLTAKITRTVDAFGKNPRADKLLFYQNTRGIFNFRNVLKM